MRVGEKGLMITGKDGIFLVKRQMNEMKDVGTEGRGQSRGCREIVATGKDIPGQREANAPAGQAEVDGTARFERRREGGRLGGCTCRRTELGWGRVSGDRAMFGREGVRLGGCAGSRSELG